MRFQYDTVIVVLVFQRMDTAIHWINQYPVDKYYQNLLSYPVDSSNLQILVHHYRDNPLFIIQILQNPSSINQHAIFENQIFLVAVDGGWNDWSQWSHCTKNVNGIQTRTRQCVNPKPQFGGTLCTSPNSTAMRGCTNISTCRQGI